MVCPRKIMADSESQEFELLNFLKRIVEKVDGGGGAGGGGVVCQTVRSEREMLRV